MDHTDLPMAPTSNFAPHTHEDWIKQAKKSLKQDDLSALRWEIEPGWWIDPFLTPDQNITSVRIPEQPLFDRGINILWTNYSVMARLITAATTRGCTSIWFHQVPAIDIKELAQLYQGESLQNFSWGFFSSTAAVVSHNMRNWSTWLSNQGLAPKSVKTIYGITGTLTEDELTGIGEALLTATEGKQAWQWCILPEKNSRWPSELISHSLKAQDKVYKAWTNAGWTKNAMAYSFVASLTYDQAFLRTSALLRAWRWVTMLMAEYHGISEANVTLDLQVRVHSDLTLERQLIRFAALSLGAALGGANRLSLEAANWNQNEEFVIRLLHGLHILQLESHIHEASDAWSGSYFLDHVTEQLAKRAWNAFLLEQ